MSLSFLNKKTVLVTGGTGSFGQKFVEIILKESKVERLIVFSRDEFKQFQMSSRLKENDDRLRFFIGDVRDLPRLERAFHGVDIVVHAAALKHVPILEYNPFEAVKTNILGSQNVIDAAINQGVQKVVLVSSDKAVSPLNLYGASKLCAEKLFIAGNAYSAWKSRFAAVRYGNVVGSRGSIVETLVKQKERGEVTVTDERMTRFWITLDQGARLVLNAIKLMRGGEIFVPKIPSMRVTDLIAALAPAAKKKIIGIRPGEKLHETLLTENEARHSSEFDGFFIIEPEFEWWNNRHLKGNKKLPENFSYASNTNKEWLDTRQLKEMIKKL